MIPTIDQVKPLISKRSAGILIICALLLNILIIATFLLIELNLDDTSLIRHLRNIPTRFKKKFKKEKWAALQPKSGLAGAPVILAQAPQPSSATPAQTQQKNIESTKNNIQRKELTEPTQLVVLDDTEKDKSPVDQQKNEIKKINATIKNKSASVNQAIQAALAKKIRQSMQQQHTLASQKQREQKPIPAQQVKQVPTQPKKPQLTFAQLVKGFSEHLKQEGEYNLAMAGQKDAKATESQLRIGRFIQKVAQCLQTSWKVNRSKYPLNHHVLANIGLRIVINKDGKLSNLILTKSSGRQILDKYVLDIIKDASKSFPPIPDYLHLEVCAIGCAWERLPLPEGPHGYVISQ